MTPSADRAGLQGLAEPPAQGAATPWAGTGHLHLRANHVLFLRLPAATGVSPAPQDYSTPTRGPPRGPQGMIPTALNDAPRPRGSLASGEDSASPPPGALPCSLQPNAAQPVKRGLQGHGWPGGAMTAGAWGPGPPQRAACALSRPGPRTVPASVSGLELTDLRVWSWSSPVQRRTLQVAQSRHRGRSVREGGGQRGEGGRRAQGGGRGEGGHNAGRKQRALERSKSPSGSETASPLTAGTMDLQDRRLSPLLGQSGQEHASSGRDPRWPGGRGVPCG